MEKFDPADGEHGSTVLKDDIKDSSMSISPLRVRATDEKRKINSEFQ